MTERDFVFWLNGFFELSEAAGGGDRSLNHRQVEIIQEHLGLVFGHQTASTSGDVSVAVEGTGRESHDPPTVDKDLRRALEKVTSGGYRGPWHAVHTKVIC